MQYLKILSLTVLSSLLFSCGGSSGSGDNNQGVNTIQASISSLSAGELTVDWSTQSNSTSAYVSNTEFTIYASTQEGFTPSDSNKKTQVTDKDSAIITGLTSNTQYFAKVSTIVNGERIWSNELSIKIAPVHLPTQTLTQNTQTSFVLNTGSNVVSCSSAPSLPSGLRVVVANNTCQITGAATTPQEAQTYTITATNANGTDNSTDSATVEIVVVANIVVSPPTNVTAIAGNQQVSLNWASVTGVSYKLHRATESFGTKAIADYSSLQGYNAAPVSVSNKTITGLTNNTQYYFVVTAVKNSVESSASNEVSATPKAPITPTPSNLIASAGNEEISLEWDNVDGASYNLYYAKESITDIQNYAALNGGTLLNNLNAANKTVTGLTNNTPYSFVVTAVKNSVESSASNEVSVNPKAPTTPTSAGVLNDTGITWGGDRPSGNNVTCTGFNISTQDCAHGRDAQATAGTLSKVGGGMAGFDFTKLGSTGNVLSVQNQPWTAGGAGTESAGTKWSCVRDNVTGLVWEVKTDEGSADGDTADNTHTNIHHKDNIYRWGGKTAIGKMHTSKAGDYYEEWTGLVDGSNSASGLCGFTDWKVPTINELDSIAHKGKTNPSIDNHYFPNTVANDFWSSSPVSLHVLYAWQLDFTNGDVSLGTRGSSDRVRLVRPRQ